MKDRIAAWIFPLLTLATLILTWHVAVVWLNVPDYILPAPGAVVRYLKTDYIDGQLWPHFLFTLRSTVTGYIVGCLGAIVLGTVVAESKIFERCFYPLIVALQSMPKVALAPLIIIWCGYGIMSKIVMVALICFFPVFVNTTVGIRQADPALLNMMKAFSASKRLIFFRVKLFAAASHIFAGLQIAVVLSLIGAVVAEFVASSRGIGWTIQASLANFNTAQMFSALLSLIAVGLTGTRIVQYVHGKVVFWDHKAAHTVTAE